MAPGTGGQKVLSPRDLHMTVSPMHWFIIFQVASKLSQGRGGSEGQGITRPICFNVARRPPVGVCAEVGHTARTSQKGGLTSVITHPLEHI